MAGGGGPVELGGRYDMVGDVRRLRGGAGARTDASCVSGKTRRRTDQSLANRQLLVFYMRWERTSVGTAAGAAGVVERV